jgi:hypothetical protein
MLCFANPINLQQLVQEQPEHDDPAGHLVDPDRRDAARRVFVLGDITAAIYPV